MTLFDVLTKREAGDAGLPKPASDAELLAWAEQIRAIASAADDDGPRRRPLVAQPRRVLRARPLVAEPVDAYAR